MAENRRQDTRQNVIFRVDGADATGHTWMSLADNISSGGLRLAHPAPVSVGDALTITFVLPDGQPHKLPARVTRVDETGCALQFLECVPAMESDDNQPSSCPTSSDAAPPPASNQASQSTEPTAQRIAEHMLAQWFGSYEPISADPVEALDQIFPSAILQPDGMVAEYTAACATQLLETLQHLGGPDAAAPDVITAALEHWQERSIPLYRAVQRHAAALIAAIDKTSPQDVLKMFRELRAETDNGLAIDRSPGSDSQTQSPLEKEPA